MFENVNNMGTGYQYNGSPANGMGMASPYKSWLTQDELQNLSNQQSKKFSLEITDEERMRAICNHRTADGADDTLVMYDNDEVRCQICGAIFRPVENMSDDNVADICNAFVAVLETIKLYSVDIPPQTAREFFQIIAVAKKVPGFVKVALNNFEAHNNYNPFKYNNSNMDAFNVFSSIINGQPVPGQPNPYFGYQQSYGTGYNPYPQQQPNQFTGYQPNQFNGYQPQYAPGMAPVQQNANTNGFGYNGPAAPQQQQGYQPSTTGYQLNGQQPTAPQQSQPQSSTVPPSSTTKTTSPDGKSVEVTANFK